jgi:hypothetical protein
MLRQQGVLNTSVLPEGVLHGRKDRPSLTSTSASRPLWRDALLWSTTMNIQTELRFLRGILVGLALSGGATVPPVGAEPPVGKSAPTFTLKQLSGRPLSLTALRGKVVFLDFWGPS